MCDGIVMFFNEYSRFVASIFLGNTGGARELRLINRSLGFDSDRFANPVLESFDPYVYEEPVTKCRTKEKFTFALLRVS